jgi:hypothetical protein
VGSFSPFCAIQKLIPMVIERWLGLAGKKNKLNSSGETSAMHEALQELWSFGFLSLSQLHATLEPPRWPGLP